MGLRHISEPRRLIIRAVLVVWALVAWGAIVRVALTTPPPVALDSGPAPRR